MMRRFFKRRIVELGGARRGGLPQPSPEIHPVAEIYHDHDHLYPHVETGLLARQVVEDLHFQ